MPGTTAPKPDALAQLLAQLWQTAGMHRLGPEIHPLLEFMFYAGASAAFKAVQEAAQHPECAAFAAQLDAINAELESFATLASVRYKAPPAAA